MTAVTQLRVADEEQFLELLLAAVLILGRL